MAGLDMQRRTFMKWIAAAPLLAQVSLQKALGMGWAHTEKLSSDNIYTRLGVKTIINGRGTWTYTGASLELPEVLMAQDEAGKHFVNIMDLQKAVGRRLAQLTGAEDGMITSGAAGAIASGTCACIAGSDPERIWQLPDTTGMKSEVVMMGGRSAFDSAIRLAGGKLVVVESHEQLANALNDNTAMIYTTSDMKNSTTEFDTLAKELAIAKRAGVPLFMDSADGVPPVDKMNRFAKMGCDLFTVSGGKGLCGPQCSGVLLGRKDLIEAALYNTNPWEGAVCRPMKVGKEEIMGCLAAVEFWYKADVSAISKEWNGRVERIAKLVHTVPGVSTSIETPTGSNCYPTLTVAWDQIGWRYTSEDCARDLMNGTPSIAVVTDTNPSGVLGRLKRPGKKTENEIRHDKLQIVSMTLQPGEEIIVGRRLRQLLTAARQRKT